MEYAAFVEACTGDTPFPYQERVAHQWREVSRLDVPTGMGKTRAVLCAFLWDVLFADIPHTTRLAYCLPVRTLVDQTFEEARDLIKSALSLIEDSEKPEIAVRKLMGGDIDREWSSEPFTPTILIGTQDQLLSRALMRGYAMRRYQWPIHFGLLHHDTRWVFDETQLMGVAVETSAQLEGLRQRFGTLSSCSSLWMSATLDAKRVDTVDHDLSGECITLDDDDCASDIISKRLDAAKPLRRLDDVVISESMKKKEIKGLANTIKELHTDGTLSLVIVNRVERAQNLYAALHEICGATPTLLIHSRFRPAERKAHMKTLSQGKGIIISTQAIEAGVDISAKLLVTELAPWSSIIQRCGRCNRRGEIDEAEVVWLDINTKKTKNALPYEVEELDEARTLLIEKAQGSIGLKTIERIEKDREERFVIRPVLRRRDLLSLFDTMPDILGDDVDVSRFIRDDEDRDVQIFWRDWEESDGVTSPPASPHPQELCRVSLHAARTWVEKLKTRRSKKGSGPHGVRKYDHVHGTWTDMSIRDLRPGMVVMAHSETGGYSTDLGWVGGAHKERVEPLLDASREETSSAHRDDSLQGDEKSSSRQWVTLEKHTENVRERAREFAERAGLDEEFVRALEHAGEAHDWGKAHEVFQQMLCGVASHPPPKEEIWAKSNHRSGSKARDRAYFRHELASALMWLAEASGEDERFDDLVAFLIAAHHGKTRVSVRSPSDEEGEQILGIRRGDQLPSARNPNVLLDLDISLFASERAIRERGVGAIESNTSFTIPLSGLFVSPCWRRFCATQTWKLVNRRSHERAIPLHTSRKGPSRDTSCRLLQHDTECVGALPQSSRHPQSRLDSKGSSRAWCLEK